MTVQDVYLLTLHEPYRAPNHPVPINATIVHALTLLHPVVPQPDGGRMYRCLTEFPGRTPGCLVPLSTLTFELDGGALWHRIGDWERAVEAVVHVARNQPSWWVVARTRSMNCTTRTAPDPKRDPPTGNSTWKS